ncbi:hypothetical protein PORY_001027, partial [Pneumocystis oryctolagi]
MGILPFNLVQEEIFKKVCSSRHTSDCLGQNVSRGSKINLDEEKKALEIEEQQLRAHLVELKAERKILLKENVFELFFHKICII